MVAVTICSDLGAWENKICHFICHEVMGLDAMIFVFFLMLSFRPTLSSSSRSSLFPSPQSRPTLCNPTDYSPLGSSVHGILLGWVAIPFSKGSSQLRNRSQISCIAGRFFTIWATLESHFKPTSSLLSFILTKRLFSSSLLSAIGVVSNAYVRLLMFLPPILTPAWNSSRLAFLIMCSACRLNKQDDSGQPWRTPFLILNQSVVPYKVLTLASWPAYRFLRRQVRWSFLERWEYQTMLVHTHIDIHKYLLPHTHRSPYT